MMKILSLFIARRDIESSHGRMGTRDRRSIDQSEVKAPGDAVREIRLGVPAANVRSEKGETIPHAHGSIAIMVTAIVDRKAV